MSTYRLDVAELYARTDDMRRQAGISWRDLGRHLDISASTFSRISAGHRPDADALITLLAWLNCEVEYVTEPAEPKP